MSSVNTTFQPLTETIVVDNTAARTITGASQRGVSTFRCVARVANAMLAWGRTSSVTSVPVPTAVGVQPVSQGGGSLNLSVGVPCYLELPADSFFIGSAAFATSNIEITGGQGGVGG